MWDPEKLTVIEEVFVEKRRIDWIPTVEDAGRRSACSRECISPARAIVSCNRSFLHNQRVVHRPQQT